MALYLETEEVDEKRCIVLLVDSTQKGWYGGDPVLERYGEVRYRYLETDTDLDRVIKGWEAKYGVVLMDENGYWAENEWEANRMNPKLDATGRPAIHTVATVLEERMRESLHADTRAVHNARVGDNPKNTEVA